MPCNHCIEITNPSKPKHYADSSKLGGPWQLQTSMVSSGNAFVDGRRCDSIKYAYRMKGDKVKLASDLRKAIHCLEAAVERIESELKPISNTN